MPTLTSLPQTRPQAASSTDGVVSAYWKVLVCSVSRLDARGAQRIVALRRSLEALHERVDRVYLHIDLDVIDPSVAQVNMFPAPHGLTTADLLAVIREIGSHIPIAAAALTAYDPDYDPDYDHDRRIPAIATGAINEIIRNATSAPRRYAAH